MGSFGVVEWIIILLIIVLFFGARRIPDMARGLAQGYVEFRKARMDDESDRESISEDRDGDQEKKRHSEEAGEPKA